MALDDFMDDDSGTETESVVETKSTSSTDTSDTNTEQSTLLDKEQEGKFYDRSYSQTSDGNIKQHGQIGYSSREAFEDTKVDEFTTHEVNPKFWYAMWPHILPEQSWGVGDRTQLKVYKNANETQVHRIRAVTCCTVQDRQLNMIPRELVMLDTNTVTKQDALETLSERFGHEVEPTDTVTLHYFADWMAMAAGTIATHDLERPTTRDLDHLRDAYVWPMSVKNIAGYQEKGDWNTMLEW